ncbi:hypothetical protein HOD83_00030 [Candidatus Woesearchaeota archaeon]|jgi:hypothetical protein|nr:hypothetical protein [Candidatus Woesearchaeota archaeon]MBT4247968.1 hypothetical protein [Candidatus Woesearchaeota archaeon]
MTDDSTYIGDPLIYSPETMRQVAISALETATHFFELHEPSEKKMIRSNIRFLVHALSDPNRIEEAKSMLNQIGANPYTTSALIGMMVSENPDISEAHKKNASDVLLGFGTRILPHVKKAEKGESVYSELNDLVAFIKVKDHFNHITHLSKSTA